MKVKTSGVMQMTLAMVISGTVGWPVVMLGQPATTVVFWRCAFGALAMLVVCALLGLLKKGLLTRRLAAIAVLGGIALVLNWTLLFAAYSYASIAVATVTYHVQPFMLVGLGVLFFGEKLTATKLGWLLLAFVGMLLIITGKQNAGDASSHYFTGVLLALGAAFMYAVAAAIVKQLKAVPPHLIVLIQLSVGALLLAPFADLGSLPSTANVWLLLATLGLVHTGLMSSLLYSAIQKIPTSLVGALSFIYPLVAIIVDWRVFGHRLSLLQLLGAAAILLAAAGMNFGWRLMRAKKTPHPADGI
ncbi:Predicted permease, DMT superfamily [Serratia proteamaculans]|uniref:DMT family transporter n=1 Tax=Serratia proteamaculans TaxID=28151 RepID=A0ABS0TU46_SERPR|nr:DMT family transporter [Serratia proteamaculans]KAB1498607.1 DMT family transporter [Serratia proteamaculans]MBI6181884.1 DMT family transporter [Serratia proteamaculans]RYM52696.1 EamA family transporter [Serratia proteamaculans]RYM55907.1 EamA family transporter [Serratia proteamaculans]CAI0774246.1 Predicted permease, DMT superfamily [Serratia proteamaculans]